MSSAEDKHGIVSCDTQWGRWYQALEEVYIDVNAPVGTKGKDVRCTFQSRKLTVIIHGKTVIEGTLPFSVHPSESTWTIQDNKVLQICLSKADPYSSAAWRSLLEGQYDVDPLCFDQMEQKLVLAKMQSQNPGFDFSNSTVSGNYHGGGPDLKA